jgi:hypothetical protein
LLFYSKTFRKKIVDWDGFEQSFQLVGSSTDAGSLDGLAPVTGAAEMGQFGDRVPYLVVPTVSDAQIPTDPNPDAAVEGVPDCNMPE